MVRKADVVVNACVVVRKQAFSFAKPMRLTYKNSGLKKVVYPAFLYTPAFT
jgi:hypothetical protein